MDDALNENISYRFYSYMRSGWGTHFEIEDGKPHASVALEALLTKAPGGEPSQIKATGKLRNDVLGFKKSAVLRTTPVENVGDYQANCFASIDFAHPELPWCLSLATPEKSGAVNIGLMPWCCLIVLEANEYESIPNDQMPSIKVFSNQDSKLSSLPDLSQAWAWAHIQVTDLGDEDQQLTLPETLSRHPERVFSRILCNRRLKGMTSYHAFVVPTFETVRRSGLGRPLTGVSALDPAWSSDIDYPEGRELPYYYSWSFGTGPRGDFEYQVSLLKPQPLPPDAGEQPFYTGEPGYLVRAPDPPEEPLRFAGALVSPVQKPQAWPSKGDPFFEDMSRFVDLAINNGLNEQTSSDEKQDPWFTPPIYGRYHALLNGWSSDPPWPRQLNTDPRHRVVAGMATRIVRKHQEELMASAWAQAGDIDEANRALRWGQLGVAITERLHARHLQGLSDPHLISMTASLHDRVQVSGQALSSAIAGSPVKGGVYSLLFRRLTRVNGRLSIRQKGRTLNRVSSAETLPLKLNDGAFQLPPLGVMDGALTLEDLIEAQLTSQVPADVAQAVREGVPYQQLPAYRHRVLSSSATRALKRYEHIRDLVSILSPQEVADQTSRSSANMGKARRPILEGQRYRQEALAAVLAAATATHPSSQQILGLNTRDTADALLQRLQPKHSIRPAILARLQLRHSGVGTTDRLDPILAYPTFSVPTCELLQEFSLERMVPGIGSIKQNSVALMKTNPAFIEVYLAALNHELGSELLWRGFPTDRRGSYFRRFWERLDDKGNPIQDISEIHTWSKRLGENGTGAVDESKLVLLIRGELLWKYPNTLIYALQAYKGSDNEPMLPRNPIPILPLFYGRLGTDIVYMAFPIHSEDLNGEGSGYFFVFEEPSFEPRFGLDASGMVVDLETWNDLGWDHIMYEEGNYVTEGDYLPLAPEPRPEVTVPAPAWGENAAAFAYILHQRPARVYVHQSELLPKPEERNNGNN